MKKNDAAAISEQGVSAAKPVRKKKNGHTSKTPDNATPQEERSSALSSLPRASELKKNDDEAAQDQFVQNMDDNEDNDEPELAEPEILPADDDDVMGDSEDLGMNDGTMDSADVIEILPPGGSGDLPVPAANRLPSVSTRDNLQLYLREVSRFPLLEPEEEVELTRRVRDSGDSDAAFRIVSSHLRLVVKIAMDFQRRWMQNVLDLIQEGNVGLMRAVNKFDPDKGIKFSYYATFWIRAYILKFIMDNWRMVKIGTTQAQRKLFYNLNKERQKLIAQGFDPSANVLSERLGVTEDQVIEMQQRLDAGDVSLDLPVNDENGSSSRIDFLPALGPGIEDSYGATEVAKLVQDGIRDILPQLSEKENYILKHRLLTDDPVTLREIGERYHVTRERIRQLEARLLNKLRTRLGEKIKDFSEDLINPQA